jgi:hypothetical protein
MRGEGLCSGLGLMVGPLALIIAGLICYGLWTLVERGGAIFSPLSLWP